VLIYASMPNLSIFARNNQPIALWCIIVPLACLRIVAFQASAITVVILLNNSALPAKLGAINGVSQTFGSLCRSIGPFIGGAMWSWSTSAGLAFPLDYRLVFLCAAMLSAIVLVLSSFLPASAEKKRTELEKEQNEKLLAMLRAEQAGELCTTNDANSSSSSSSITGSSSSKNKYSSNV
jgi:MFS family permease